MTWVDTHCHLQLDVRPASDLLDRATDVDWLVVPGIDADSSRQALALADRYPGRVVAAVGLHPHLASSWDEQGDAIIEMVDGAVAVGETGLDFYRELSPRDVQEKVFRAHVSLAVQMGKPLIVHTRDAFAAVHDIVSETGVGPQTVLHCWTAGTRWTRRFLDLGVMYSFAGPITFATGQTIRLGAALVPPGRALVETDTPFLTPPPHRGEPNEPAWVGLVGAALAEVWGMDVGEVARVTSENAHRLFGA